jgi:hypothetical protein
VWRRNGRGFELYDFFNAFTRRFANTLQEIQGERLEMQAMVWAAAAASWVWKKKTCNCCCYSFIISSSIVILELRRHPPAPLISPSVCTPSIRSHADQRNSNNVISWVISSFRRCNGDDGSTLEKQLRFLMNF